MILVGLVPVLHLGNFLRTWLAVRHDRGHNGSTGEHTLIHTYMYIYTPHYGIRNPLIQREILENPDQ